MSINQRISGFGSLAAAGCFLFSFFMYAVVVTPPVDETPLSLLKNIQENYVGLYAVYFIVYAAFGFALVPMTVGFYEQQKQHQPNLAKATAIFGILWIALVVATSFVFTVGMTQSIKLAETDINKAADLWFVCLVIVESLGGGNEIVGGIWVGLFSLTANRFQLVSKSLAVLGIIIGITGLFTVLPQEEPKMVFGLCLLIWFIWLGFAQIKQAKSANQPE